MTENELGAEQPMQSMNWLSIYPTISTTEREFLDRFSISLGNFPKTQDIVLAVDEAIDKKSHQGAQLQAEELSLLKNVFGFISEGVSLGLDEGVDIRNREIADAFVKQKFLERTGDLREWNFYSGFYGGDFVEPPQEVVRQRKIEHLAESDSSTQQLHEQYIPHEQTGDTVEFLTKRLKKLLEVKKDAPVVMVDIGGMYGTTMLELASVFPEEIHNGKLLLVVTNLTLDKEKIDLRALPTNGTGMPNNYSTLYKQYGDMVHFVVSDVQGLVGKKITLPDGSEFQIGNGSCDILHESWSISTNSKILEKEAETLADLVGTKGIILSRRTDSFKRTSGISTPRQNMKNLFSVGFSLLSFFANTPVQGHEETKNQMAFRTRPLLDARLSVVTHNLHAKGLQEISSVVDQEQKVHSLNYAVWMGSQAEPLDIVDYKGNSMSVQSNTPTEESSKEKEVNALTRLISRIKNI
jgi:hypothetical protein